VDDIDNVSGGMVMASGRVEESKPRAGECNALGTPIQIKVGRWLVDCCILYRVDE